MKSRKLTKYTYLAMKMLQFFLLNQFKSGPDSKFLKRFTVLVQSKSKKIVKVGTQSYPNPVPMLISGRGGHGSGVPESTPAEFYVFWTRRWS